MRRRDRMGEEEGEGAFTWRLDVMERMVCRGRGEVVC